MNELALSLFEWVLRNSWQASILVGLVVLTQWLFRKQLSVGWRYALWLLVLIRLVLPEAPASKVSVYNVTSNAYVTAKERLPFTRDRTLPGEMDMGSPTKGLQSASTAETVTPSSEAKIMPPPNRASQAPGFTMAKLTSWLPWLWLTGVGVLGLRIVWQNLWFWRRLRRHTAIQDPAVHNILQNCANEMAIRTPLVLETTAVESPALYGVWRCRLLVPSGLLESLTPQQLRHVFLHELAHLKRRDMQVNWVMNGLQLLHWFNPVIWWAMDRMRADRELACDHLALKHCHHDGQNDYGNTIIKLLEGLENTSRPAGVIGIIEDKHQITNRITMIANYKSTRSWSLLAIALLVGLGMSCLTDGETTPEATKNADAGLSSETGKPGLDPGLTIRRLRRPDAGRGFMPTTDGRFFLHMHKDSSGKRKGFVLEDMSSGVTRPFDFGTEELPGFPLFSKDGKYIVASFNGLTELRVIEVETGEVASRYHRDETKQIFARGWSLDGKSIVCLLAKEDQSKQLAIMSVKDGSIRVLKESIGTDFPRAFFAAFISPNGRYVAFTEEEDIAVLSIDTGEESIAVNHPANDKIQGWAEQGNQIVFTSNRRGTWDLFALSMKERHPAGSPRLIKTELGGKGGFYSWGLTRAGKLYYHTTVNRLETTYWAKLSANGMVVSPPTDVDPFNESGNGDSGISKADRFKKRGDDLVKTLETGETRKVAIGASIYGSRSVSPDGSSFLFHGGNEDAHGIFQSNLITGKTSLLVKVPKLNRGILVRWAPNGNVIYYQTDNAALTRFDLTTREEKAIAIDPPDVMSFKLSPDGEQLVFIPYTTASHTICRMPVSGGSRSEVVRISSDDGSYITDFDWSPDGAHLYFSTTTRDSRGSIWRVPASGGPPESLGIDMDGLIGAEVSADGSHLVFTVGESRSTEAWVVENFLPSD